MTKAIETPAKVRSHFLYNEGIFLDVAKHYRNDKTEKTNKGNVRPDGFSSLATESMQVDKKHILDRDRRMLVNIPLFLGVILRRRAF